MKTNTLHQALFLLLVMVAFLLTSCIHDRPVELVEQAIAALELDPGNWREIFDGAITNLDDLGSARSRQIRTDVEVIYQRALSEDKAITFCGDEFVGNRLHDRLQAIIHKYDNKKYAPEITPIICKTEPAEVRTDQTDVVHYYGFDLKEFDGQQGFWANIHYQDSEEPLDFLDPTVDIIAEDYLAILLPSPQLNELDSGRSPQLVLKWGEENVSIEGRPHEIAIILPGSRIMDINGWAVIKDDELLGNDVYGELPIRQQVVLSPLDATGTPLHFEKCVGDEVRLEIDLDIEMLDDLSIEIVVEASLYEGSDCNNNDLGDAIKEEIHLARDNSYEWKYKLVNSESYGGDTADITINFFNKTP